MKLTLNGKTYQSAVMPLYDISMAEAIRIKALTGMTIADWRLGLLTWNRQDPDTIRALVLLLKSRAGEQFHMDEINMMSATELVNSFDWSEDNEEMQAQLQALIAGRDAGEPTEQPAEPAES